MSRVHRLGHRPLGHRLAGVTSSALAAVLVLAVTGCAQTPAQKAAADMRAFNNEATADKLFERGKGFASVGDYTRAEEYLAAAIDNGTSPRLALPLLMDVCVRGGRYRSAIQHGETQLRKHPNDHRTRLMVGTLYAALDEPARAREELDRVVEAKPDEPQAHYVLAVVARDKERDPIDADRHFREYLRLEPNGSHAEEARASLLKKVNP